jgi:hypothetical protein
VTVWWSGGYADATAGANTADVTPIALTPAARRTQPLFLIGSDISYSPFCATPRLAAREI